MSTHPSRHRAAVVAPLVLVALAGALLVWTPAGTSLPDPGAMALLGDGRRTSEEIVAFWTERVVDAPHGVGTRTALARAQVALAADAGDLAGFETAERTALDALAAAPDDPGALLALAAARAGQHRFHEAMALAERVLAEDPASVPALLAIGDAQLAIGGYDQARDLYDRALADVGAVAPLLSRMARLEASVGSLASARDLARRALVAAGDADLRHQDAAFYWFQLASYEFASGDPNAARERLDAALEIDPGNRGALELLGSVLGALGQEQAAISVYEELVDDGRAADLHGLLADLYGRAGREEEAERHVRLGLDVAAATADRFPAERRHLIGFLVDHDPDEALRLATLDLEERQDVQAHGWYAWALYRTGDVAGARAAIEPALVRGTEDARLLYQAGVIHHAAGDRAAAKQLLRRALEINPYFDVDDADEARRLLATG